MTVHFYGVLDADGVKINTITADDELLKTDWYPGYGAYLIDEGEVPPEPLPEPPPKRPDTFAQVLPALKEPMRTGDALDIKSGKVTPAPIVIDPIAEPPVQIDPVVLMEPPVMGKL